MAIKDIVVFLDNTVASDVRLDLAIEIARNHDAFLVGAFVASEAILGRHQDEFARGPGIDAVVERETAAEDADAARAARHFAEATRAQGIDAAWRPIAKYGTAADVVLQARYADLSIVGQSSGDRANVLWSFEDMLFAFGGPTLVVPRGASAPVSVGRNILVAWDASREAKRAVADAMPFLAKADRVTILVIDAGGLTARGHGPGGALARRLGRHGINATVAEAASSGRNIGQVIIDHAGQVDADLIVMGAYGHWRVIEWAFGGATRTVLQQLPVPVLMSH